jgi:hypothetical protein
MTAPLAWIDHEHDRASASDGVSRYGAYLRQRADWFRDEYSPASFAATAWQVATSPVMSPGLVRMRPDLHGINVAFDEDGDGILRATVHVPIPFHDIRSLSGRIGYQVSDWQTERSWDPDGPRYEEPRPSRDRSALLITAAVIMPVDVGRLPGIDAGDCDPVNRLLALDAVSELVYQINGQASGLVDTLRERS